MKVRSKQVWVGLAGLVLLAAGITVGMNRFEYGGFDPWSAPEHFEDCGAQFSRHDDGPKVGMDGDGAIVTEAQALSISGSAALVPHGSTGLFGRWRMYVPGGFECPQDTSDERFGWIFVSLGPDRYLDLTDME